MPNDDLKRKWDEAFANPGKAVPVADLVVCDSCDQDFTSSAEPGGFIFQSKAIGPCCAASWEREAENFGETHFIRARAKPGESFADFVRRYRGPNAAVEVALR